MCIGQRGIPRERRDQILGSRNFSERGSKPEKGRIAWIVVLLLTIHLRDEGLHRVVPSGDDGQTGTECGDDVVAAQGNRPLRQRRARAGLLTVAARFVQNCTLRQGQFAASDARHGCFGKEL
jgi:hypothetical protein